MFVEWTKHLNTSQDKEEFYKSVYGSKNVLDRLVHILDEKEKTLDRTETDIRVFEQPNWAYRQAFKNGQREALSFLKKLVNLEDQKGPNG